MKKFSIIAAFVFAVMISSTALAANWVELYSSSDKGASSVIYVDKDSIRRGIQSKTYNFSREDGFSAIVKMEFKDDNDKIKTIILSWLTGFFEENGKKKYCLLDEFDENGNLKPKSFEKVEASNADGTDGASWPIIYEYIQKNLP